MDINKEREAFERLPLAELAIKSEYVYYNEETNSYWPNEDFCPSDAPETMNFAWEAWQSAKAQTDQKIKSLLCDEHLKKCESPTGIFNSQYSDEEPCLICLAKQAKAQTVPEGFVLIKDDTKTVVAIERMVEQQVEASGMDSRRLERLDGWKIIEAAVKAQEQV